MCSNEKLSQVTTKLLLFFFSHLFLCLVLILAFLLTVWATHTAHGIYMCRVLPKLMPLAFAPLFVPYCKLMTPSPARN
jgi:type IV secretory pathway VirB6-like protein